MQQGRWLQVIYVLKKQDEVDYDSVDPMDWAAMPKSSNAKIARIIHAMELTLDMKRQLRHRRR